MNIFKSTKFTWWQLALLKWSALFFGLAFGSLMPDLFAPYAPLLFALALAVGAYLGFVWIKGK
jgi:hypothetical protein